MQMKEPMKVEHQSASGDFDQKEASILSKWKTFATNTSLHGLKHTVKVGERSYFRRFIWILFLGVSTAYFTKTVAVCLLKFTSLPLHTTYQRL